MAGSDETGTPVPVRAQNALVKTDRRERVVRVSSFAVAGVLGLLVVTSVVPPLVADQSDRAVVNAPVTLLTTQIAGEVKDLAASPGQRLDANQTVGRVVNEKVDRTTEITLESKLAEAQHSVEATRLKRSSTQQYISALDAEISQQTAELDQHFVEQIAEINARIGSAEALQKEKGDLLSRQTNLVQRDAMSPETVTLAERRLSAAGHDKEAETSLLNQKQGQLDALRRGIFVGDDLVELATLAQKRRDLTFEAQRLGIEEDEFASSAQASEGLLSTERSRLDMLADSKVTAPHAGRVMSAGASNGRHVLPGDTIATLVDCDRSFIAAIFSYRSAQDLEVGTRMRIESRDWSEPHYGKVKEVLPRLTDKEDDRFAVSFPPTERRELYVVVEPDHPTKQDMETSDNLCSIGRWVTVSRDNGWVPSTSVLWHNAGRVVASIVGAPFAAANAADASNGIVRRAVGVVDAKTR
jgi:multidrug resistance efflux pump